MDRQKQNGPKAARRRHRPPAAGDVADRVHAALVEAITDQRLAPGAKLAEVELASVFGCSRRSVEQALIRLVVEGLAVRAPNRGAFVATPSPVEAREMFALRRAVEGAVVRDLAGRADTRTLAPLHAAIAEETEARAQGDERRAIRLSGAFHIRLAEAAGNAEFARLIDRLVARTSLVTQLYGAVGAMNHWCRDHAELLDAIARRDAGAAAELMDRHLSSIESANRLDVATRPASVLRRALIQPR